MKATANDIIRLREIGDDLQSIAERATDPDDSRSTSPAQMLRKASYLTENAIGELMQKAAEQKGVEITDIRTMRPAKEIRRAA